MTESAVQLHVSFGLFMKAMHDAWRTVATSVVLLPP